jgi:hypothetical protein
MTTLADLPPIDLAELTADAALMTRVDRKYVLPSSALPGLVDALPDGTRRLTIDGRTDFGYRSVYLDTPELDCFQSAAGRRRRRFKIRTRRYLDSGDCWLEVKTRGARGATVKQRREHPDPDGLAAGLPFVRAVLSEAGVRLPASLDFRPSLVTEYRRTTLHLPDGSRATVDTGLRWSDPEHPVDATLPGRLILETKSGHGAGSLDHTLWQAGHRPDRISKYATGLLLLHPDLTGRPWRRTLRRAAAD